MNAIGDEEGEEFVTGEEALNDIVVAMKVVGNAIAEVGAESGPGIDGAADVIVWSCSVSQGNLGSRIDEDANKIFRAGEFGSESDKADIATGGFLEALEGIQIGWSHPSGIMSPAISGFGRKPGAFQVVAAHGLGELLVLASK